MNYPARGKIGAGRAERLLTGILMAVIALVANSVNPGADEVRSNIERLKEPYFRAFLSRCMARVQGGDRR